MELVGVRVGLPVGLAAFQVVLLEQSRVVQFFVALTAEQYCLWCLGSLLLVSVSVTGVALAPSLLSGLWALFSVVALGSFPVLVGEGVVLCVWTRD